jgi:PAS domain-containing protein
MRNVPVGTRTMPSGQRGGGAGRDDAGAAIAIAGVALDVTLQLAERERAEMLADRARLVAETMGVGFWSRDLDGGGAYWDDQMFRIHRRDPAAGAPGFDDWFDQYVHPTDRSWVRQLHAMASRDWQPVIDATFRAPDGADGAERWIQTWTRRLVRDGRRLAFGMHMDVSDRQRIQMRQQRESARMQFALEVADVGVW